MTATEDRNTNGGASPLRGPSTSLLHRPEAITAARAFVDHLDGTYEQLTVAGSLRRRLAYVGDIEIVAPNWYTIVMETKTCTLCHIERPITAFWRDKNRPDGLYPSCKACSNERKRDAYAGNPESKRAANKNYSLRNTEKMRAYYARWHQENKERRWAAVKQRLPTINARLREADRRYREAHPERRLETYRRYRQGHKEQNREQCARRKARIRMVSLERVDYRAILERDDWMCHICGQRVESRDDLQFDHIIPLSRGGPHSYDNIAVAHARCNNQKGPRLDVVSARRALSDVGGDGP